MVQEHLVSSVSAPICRKTIKAECSYTCYPLASACNLVFQVTTHIPNYILGFLPIMHTSRHESHSRVDWIECSLVLGNSKVPLIIMPNAMTGLGCHFCFNSNQLQRRKETLYCKKSCIKSNCIPFFPSTTCFAASKLMYSLSKYVKVKPATQLG
jgi:hypothetical protein